MDRHSVNSDIKLNPSYAPLRVLIVEDNPVDADLMVLRLTQEGFQLDWCRVEKESDYLKALESPYDLILSDWALPQFNGLRALQLMRERGLDCPFIIISGSIGEEVAVTAMRQGASDYLLKDRMDRLGQAVKNALEQKRTKEEYRRAAEALAASEAELRALFASMRDVVLVLDREGVFRRIAPTNPDLLVKPAQELVGQRLQDLFPLDQAAKFHRTIQKVLENQETQYIEYKLVIENQSVWFETAISPISDHEVLWVARDIRERKRAEAYLKQYAKRQEKIAALGRALTATLDLEVIYRTAERYIKSMIDCPNFSFTLYDSQQAILKAVYFSTGGVLMDVNLLPPLKYNPQYSSSGRSKAIASQTPEIVHNLEIKRKKSGGMLVGNDKEPQSAIHVPMIVEGKVIGLMDLQSYRTGVYTKEDGEWLSVVANQIGMAIQNARLFAETQQRIAELSALAVIDSALTSHVEPQEIYHILLDQVTTRLEVDAAALFLLNPHNQMLECVSECGYKDKAILQEQLRLGESLSGKVALQKQMLHMNHLSSENIHLLKGQANPDGFEEYFGAPLLVDGKIIGVLDALHRSRLTPNRNWLRFFEMLAGRSANVIATIQLYEDVRHANEELLKAYDATIEGWSQAMDLRDKETEGHTLRVTEMALQLAQAMGLDEEKLIHIHRGALLHDIGKLGIPDDILHKPGPLTDDEWVLMKKHPLYAYHMLESIEYLRPAMDIPYNHHEKWDGSGYPRGLKGEEIPLAARLFAVIDVWDALTSDRPYRPKWTKEAALQYIIDQSGKHFDPRVVMAFLNLFK